jgi:hypothetical protein
MASDVVSVRGLLVRGGVGGSFQDALECLCCLFGDAFVDAVAWYGR